MAKTQTTLKREIRVFISSTFSDMQAERNYLVKKIFPDIERECRKRNVEFIALDLRWGITEEEAKQGKVVEICINEIDRTRPFFIGLIGGRYGWVPGEGDDFDTDRISQTMPWIRPYLEAGMSITEMEMRYGVLDSNTPVHANFFIRKERNIPSSFRETEQISVEKLRRLKSAVRSAAEDGLCTVSDYGSMKSLGKFVRKQLMTMIDSLFPKEENPSVYDLYAARHNHKISELQRFHHPRIPDLLDDIRLNERVLLTASSYGSGLSAIATNEIPDDLTLVDSSGTIHHPRVIRSFIDTDVYSEELLKRMFINSLHQVFPDVEIPEILLAIDMPIDFKEIVERFPKEEYLWIIDSPENFADSEERNIMKLVDEASFIFRLVVVSSDPRIRNLCASHSFHIRNIGSPTVMDLRTITTNYLRYYGKALSERQISAITGSSVFSNVKMLVVFLDILRNFGVYEDVDKFIHNFVTLNSEEEFFSKYLDYLEDEFSEKAVAEFFRRLQVIDLGMSEKGLLRDLWATRIEQSAFMCAIENLLSRKFHNYILPATGMLAGVVAERYPVSDSDCKRVSRLLIRDYTQRMDEIVRSREFSLSDRFYGLVERMILRNHIMLDDNGLMAEWSMLRATVVILHARNGNVKNVIRMIRHFGIMSVVISRPKDIPDIIHILKMSGYKPYSMMSSVDIIVEKLLMENYYLSQTWLRFALNLEEKEQYLKKLKRMILPPKIKRGIITELEMEDTETLLIDMWDENFDFEHDDFSYQSCIRIFEQSFFILAYRNDDYVREIFEKLKRTLPRTGPTDLARGFLLRSALICAVRLNDKRSYQSILTEIEGSEVANIIEADLIFLDIFFTMKNIDDNVVDEGSLLDKANKYVSFVARLSQKETGFNSLVCRAIIMFLNVREGIATYSPEEIAEVVMKSGSVIEAFFFNNRKEIAAFLLPAILTTDLSLENKVYYGGLYAACLKEKGHTGEAIEQYCKMLKMVESTDFSSKWVSVQSILCDLIICCEIVNDYALFDKYSNRLVDYAEKGTFGCDKNVVFNRVSSGYYRMSQTSPDMLWAETAREKALEFSQRAYEADPSDHILWCNYVSFQLKFQNKHKTRIEDLTALAVKGKKLMTENPKVDNDFIKILGKLFIITGMDEDFDILLRRFPHIVYRDRVMENYARLLETETDPAKRNEYVKYMVADIKDFLLFNYFKKDPVPVDFLVSTILRSREGPKIASILIEKSGKDELSTSYLMLAACVCRGLGDSERGDTIERDVATYLLEGEGRFELMDHLIYGLFKSDCPYHIYDSMPTKEYLMDRYISTDKKMQELYLLRVNGLYDEVKAKEYVANVFASDLDYDKMLTEMALLFRKYADGEQADAFVQFCRSINEERKHGKPLSMTLLKVVSEAAEKIVGAMYAYKDTKILCEDAWREIVELLRSGKLIPGSNMTVNGLYVTDAATQYELYKEYYSVNKDTVDHKVGVIYMQLLYYSEKNNELYDKVLAELSSRITPDNKYWQTLQEEVVLNCRRKGEYTAAMDAYNQLYDYYLSKNISIEESFLFFPLVTSLLCGNFEEFHLYCDRMKSKDIDQKLLDILNCAYFLKVDNLISAEKLYDEIRPVWDRKYIDTGEDVPSVNIGDNGLNSAEMEEEDDMWYKSDKEIKQIWSGLVAYTSYRFIELARYYLRHEDYDESEKALTTAERLLNQIKGSYPYFHHELKKLASEMVSRK